MTTVYAGGTDLILTFPTLELGHYSVKFVFLKLNIQKQKGEK